MFAMKAKRFCQCGKELERSQTKDGRAARWPKYCSPECQAEAYKINQPTAVYTLANASGEPLYVGVSSNLKQRMIAHKATKDWWESVANIDFEDFTNRLEAEVREAELIKVLRPLHNRAIPVDPTSTPDTTDGMNRVLVVFSDGLLSELDLARGLVSRSAWIRQAVENELGRDRVFKATYGTKAFEQMKEAVAPLVPWTESDIVYDAEVDTMPKPLVSATTFKPKPKARRKKVTVGDLESDEPIDLMVALKASIDAKKAQAPARCNRGACTGTIKPNGRCIRCNQEPLKESK
jgi:predicted GIY-YIG superfamily endonuclease